MIMSRFRNYLFPLATIVIASSIAWWSSSATTRVTTHIRDEVKKLIPQYQASPSAINSMLVDPILKPSLKSSLSYIYKKSTESQAFSVVVSCGDSEEYGDGTATHVAVLCLNNKPVTSLRIICENENAPLKIAGVVLESPKVLGAATH